MNKMPIIVILWAFFLQKYLPKDVKLVKVKTQQHRGKTWQLHQENAFLNLQA